MSGYGRQTPTDSATEFNSHAFLIQQFIRLIRTGTIVRVVSCTNDGDLDPVGFVDVLPLVNMVDGVGTVSKHDVIHNVPYSCLQGGYNAVIMDPEPGDIGVAFFADSDLSAVKASKTQSPPGSFRKFDSADGLYVGWVLNGKPVQYVQFQTGIGITVHDVNNNTIVMGPAGIVLTDDNGNIFNMEKGQILMTTPLLAVTGSIQAGVSGALPVQTIKATGNITSGLGGADQVDAEGHVHSGVTAGGVNTGPPVAGT